MYYESVHLYFRFLITPAFGGVDWGLSNEKYEAFLHQRSIEITHPLAASLGRVGQPEEVGELIAFLVRDHAKFITGECIAIDGGRQNLGAR